VLSVGGQRFEHDLRVSGYGLPPPARTEWASMSSGPKRIALTALVLAEAGLAALTWRDLRDRPAEEIRGSKRFWRIISTINPGNSVAYWLVGRRYGRSRRA
jgi:hypothetical protein